MPGCPQHRKHRQGVERDEQHGSYRRFPRQSAGQDDLAVCPNGEAAQHLPERPDLGDHHEGEHGTDQRSLRQPQCTQLGPLVEHRQERHPTKIGSEYLP